MQSPSVLVIHNCYQQPGGEGAAVGAEVELLRNAGHRVITYFRDNRAIAGYSPLKKAVVAGKHDLEPANLCGPADADSQGTS